jgi:hypothetical protein
VRSLKIQNGILSRKLEGGFESRKRKSTETGDFANRRQEQRVVEQATQALASICQTPTQFAAVAQKLYDVSQTPQQQKCSSRMADREEVDTKIAIADNILFVLRILIALLTKPAAKFHCNVYKTLESIFRLLLFVVACGVSGSRRGRRYSSTDVDGGQTNENMIKLLTLQVKNRTKQVDDACIETKGMFHVSM